MNYKAQATAPVSAADLSGGRLRSDYSLGYALLRAMLGVNIAMHGISRILAGVGTFATGAGKRVRSNAAASFCGQRIRARIAMGGSVNRTVDFDRPGHTLRAGRGSAAHDRADVWQHTAPGLADSRAATDLRDCVRAVDCVSEAQLVLARPAVVENAGMMRASGKL